MLHHTVLDHFRVVPHCAEMPIHAVHERRTGAPELARHREGAPRALVQRLQTRGAVGVPAHLRAGAVPHTKPGPMGVAGPQVSAPVRQMLDDKGMHYHPEHQVQSVEGTSRRHGQVEIAARNLARTWMRRGENAQFDGHGAWFIEAGGGKAGFGSGEFYAEPTPQIRLHAPGRWWHLGKVLFEKGWLRQRF